MEAPIQPATTAPTVKTNVISIISLIAGILGILVSCLSAIPFVGWIFIVFGGIFGVAALVLGVLGMNQVKKKMEKGRGLAIAGIVLGCLILLGACSYAVSVVFMGGSFLSSFFSSTGNTITP